MTLAVLCFNLSALLFSQCQGFLLLSSSHLTYVDCCFSLDVFRLKLELEQCVQAIRDTELQQQHEDKLAGARNDEVRTNMEMERKAVEERELLTELAMSRMTDKMKLLEQENQETKNLMLTMELQMERLREDRGENEELDMTTSSSEVVLTVNG